MGIKYEWGIQRMETLCRALSGPSYIHSGLQASPQWTLEAKPSYRDYALAQFCRGMISITTRGRYFLLLDYVPASFVISKNEGGHRLLKDSTTPLIYSFSSFKAKSALSCSPTGQKVLTEDHKDRCTSFDDLRCGFD